MTGYNQRNKKNRRGNSLLLILLISLFILTVNISASEKIQTVLAENLQVAPSFAEKKKFVGGEVLVKYKTSVSVQTQQGVMASLGGKTTKPVSKKAGVSRVKLQEGRGVIETVQAFMSDPNVEHAQPNYIYSAFAIPDDTSYGQLWGLKNTGQTISNPVYPTSNPGTAGYDIDAELAWDQITDCQSMTVAVIDTGINYQHEDLAGNMWDGSGAGFPNHGWDFVDNDNDPMPEGATEDHGTHVAGILGAYGDNATGITGVCWRASIMSLRVLDANGLGTTADIISAVEFASDNGADVINMSLGGEASFDTLGSQAIDYARANDVVVVVAAGNSGVNNEGPGEDDDPSTILQPCSYTHDNLICVAALDQAYSRAEFSNYGSVSVDVGAPGTNILSSYDGRKITDDFTGWTSTGDWVGTTCNSIYILTNPSNSCPFGAGSFYLNNANDVAYKNIDLSSSLSASLGYISLVHTEPGVDLFSTAMSSAGGDPFAGGGSILQTSSGTILGEYHEHDVTSCNTATCTIGYRFTSDASPITIGYGVMVLGFTINTVETNRVSTTYYPELGTSMAAPHVAGIAAMVRAFNPSYTYAQAVEAIKNGGELAPALSGITTTGRSVNAMGSIAYITQPTGLSAVVQ